MNKEEFVESIDVVKSIMELGREDVSKWGEGVANLISSTAESVGDENGLIEWFCFETNFGKSEFAFYDLGDGNEIRVDSAEVLYDIINME